MKYSFKINDLKIKPGFWQMDESRRLIHKKWITLLSNTNNDQLLAYKKELSFVDANGNPFWKNPLICPGIPNNAYLSGDRLLVTTDSEDWHAWGNLGPAVLVDITNGKIIKELTGETAASLSKGKFLLGLVGYDVFDTCLYEPDGNLLQTWRSCGHYVVGENDLIRVIEQDRKSETKAHVVRLNLDGSIEKGYKLKTSKASNPVCLSNGDIIFENSGELVIVDLALKEVGKLKLIDISEENSWRFLSRITLNENTLTVNILERLEEPSRDYQTHEWIIELKEHISSYPQVGL